ncbi:rCG37961 [Rattus norvegicus]|uniref:RCG37961 n=1 Tax=Rattus norvegicus TaxID=10116 RepID=A6K5W8_RAT|nr:rCG37961 [Rattus norvegicus]
MKLQGAVCDELGH